jgi:hypothetical protein
VAPVSEADAIRSEIETSRAEMARTLDALSVRLDPRVQSHKVADQLSARAQRAYEQARAAAPEPARNALDRISVAAKPYVQRALAEPKRTAMIAGGTVAGLLLLRRLGRHGRHC